MPVNTDEGVLTRNHNRLLNIAKAANIFAWIALGMRMLLAISNVVSYLGEDGLKVFLESAPSVSIRFITNTLATMIHGLVFWLVLKGIAMGLNMIVETDVNYRLRDEGCSNE